jgi:hypothetical protein
MILSVLLPPPSNLTDAQSSATDAVRILYPYKDKEEENDCAKNPTMSFCPCVNRYTEEMEDVCVASCTENSDLPYCQLIPSFHILSNDHDGHSQSWLTKHKYKICTIGGVLVLIGAVWYFYAYEYPGYRDDHEYYMAILKPRFYKLIGYSAGYVRSIKKAHEIRTRQHRVLVPAVGAEPMHVVKTYNHGIGKRQLAFLDTLPKTEVKLQEYS